MFRPNHLASALAATIVAAAVAQATDLPAVHADPRVELSANAIELRPDVPSEHLRLTVSGGEGVVFSRTYDGVATVRYDLTDGGGGLLPDGRYRFSLKATRPGEEGSAPQISRIEGGFEIDGGLLRPPVPLAPPPAPPEALDYHAGDVGIADEVCAGCSAAFDPGSNLYGAEQLTLIDSSPGINFLQSENTNDLADNGWELAVFAGDGSNFYLADLGANGFNDKIPVQVEDDTPTNTLYLDSAGNVGLGTSNPQHNLHLADGASIYFEGTAEWELDGSEDFALTLWDNGSGSFLGTPFTVENNNAQTPSGVGVGIWRPNPRATLHVGSPNGDGSAQVLVEETSPDPERRQLFRLENNGPPEFALVDNDLDLTWKFGTRGTGFEINRGNSGQTELLLRANGDLEIAGTLHAGALTQVSSRALKENFRAIAATDILDRVNALPLLEWSYKGGEEGERHFGPMAEDFHATFGLGNRSDRLAPGDAAGIALAAIQGLNDLVDERGARIVELEQGLATLRAFVEEELGDR